MSTRSCSLALALLLLATTHAARGAVTQARPDGFTLDIPLEIAAPPAAVWAALGRPASWWSPSHSWSGDARNFSLPLEAGACFCERWSEGSVEHARVLFVQKEKLLRLGGALGPLQPLAVTGVVTFTLTPAAKGTQLAVQHRVSGDPSHGLDQIAPFADQMLVETLARLKKFVETGKPE